ncbi:hypothetical protein, partial [Pontibacter diazotrophicus]|uniref:hypothetical protein n=1 Tax=Pontibacter diazotrophicus TaxID=1400979 RepID=UPI001FE5FE27
MFQRYEVLLVIGGPGDFPAPGLGGTRGFEGALPAVTGRCPVVSQQPAVRSAVKALEGERLAHGADVAVVLL